MKQKLFFIFLMLFVKHCTTADHNIKVRDTEKKTKINFARSGLFLREQPGIHSKALSKIPYGGEAVIIDESGPEMKIDRFSGKWTKVQWKSEVGFVFGGYLLEKEDFISFDIARKFTLEKLRTHYNAEKFRQYYGIKSELEIDKLSFLESARNNDHKIYLFKLTKREGEENTCSSYGSSECINAILDKNNKIIYTNINYEPIGDLIHIDQDIAVFQIVQGEGNNCGSYSITSGHIFIFTEKKMIKFRHSESGRCRLGCRGSSTTGICIQNAWIYEKKEEYSDLKGNRIIPSEKIKKYMIEKFQDN